MTLSELAAIRERATRARADIAVIPPDGMETEFPMTADDASFHERARADVLALCNELDNRDAEVTRMGRALDDAIRCRDTAEGQRAQISQQFAKVQAEIRERAEKMAGGWKMAAGRAIASEDRTRDALEQTKTRLMVVEHSLTHAKLQIKRAKSTNTRLRAEMKEASKPKKSRR